MLGMQLPASDQCHSGTMYLQVARQTKIASAETSTTTIEDAIPTLLASIIGAKPIPEALFEGLGDGVDAT